MKKLLILLSLSLIFAVSCEKSMRVMTPESEEKPDESQNDTDTDTDTPDTTPDEGDTVIDDTDTNPVPDDTNPVPDDTDSIPDDADSMTDNDTDTPEEQDEETLCENGETKTAECKELPQNAVWNTAKYIKQTCGSEGFAPSNTGNYNEEAASSTFENTNPSFTEPLPPNCPEGTGDVDGLCEYTDCGQYAYVMYFTSKNGTFIYKHDPTSTCFKEANASSEQAPCCCSKPLYKFSKSGEIQETYDPASNPMEYASSFTESGGVASTDEWVCTSTVPCENNYEYGKETGKCYKCLGELSFDGTQYQCRIEISSECRFKCKAGFSWDGSSCK